MNLPAREKSCVIRVVVWGKQAEPAARHLGRGSIVFVAGHLRQREIAAREGGQHRGVEMVAERVEFLSEPVGHAREVAQAFLVPLPSRPKAG